MTYMATLGERKNFEVRALKSVFFVSCLFLKFRCNFLFYFIPSIFVFSFAVFNHPVTCEDGHSFCKECITKWQVNNTRCPVDRSNLHGLLVRNLAVEGAIAKKIVKCTSTIARPGGCHWTGNPKTRNPESGITGHCFTNTESKNYPKHS